jgi:hypothetical protein
MTPFRAAARLNGWLRSTKQGGWVLWVKDHQAGTIRQEPDGRYRWEVGCPALSIETRRGSTSLDTPGRAMAACEAYLRNIKAL